MGRNCHAYVNGNPLIAVDPSGRECRTAPWPCSEHQPPPDALAQPTQKSGTDCNRDELLGEIEYVEGAIGRLGGRGRTRESTPVFRCSDDPDMYGMTFCCEQDCNCKSFIYYCGPYNSARGCIQMCYQVHEGRHASDCQQDKWGYGPGCGQVEENKFERSGYCAELRCLIGQLEEIYGEQRALLADCGKS
jgi:hypothetical protein